MGESWRKSHRGGDTYALAGMQIFYLLEAATVVISTGEIRYKVGESVYAELVKAFGSCLADTTYPSYICVKIRHSHPSFSIEFYHITP